MKKIVFKKVRLKNFRSISNDVMEINFNTPSTLITSTDNGSGKSSVTNAALCFALFGKPYNKGQKKSSLVNSTNARDCLVELDFDTKGKSYTIRRGIKPDLFEIYEDGKVIDQDAKQRDYQEVLNAIVGVDEKILFNSVFIGKDKFVPFVEMSASERRHYVENMLDLMIFTDMNELNKEEIKQANQSIDIVENSIFKNKTLKNSTETLVRNLEESKANKHVQLEKRKSEILNDISVNNLKKDAVITKISLTTTQDVSAHTEWLSKADKVCVGLGNRIYEAKNKLIKLNKDVSSIDTSVECMMCGGVLDKSHVIKHKKELQDQIPVVTKAMNRDEEALHQLNLKKAEKELVLKKEQVNQDSIKALHQQLIMLDNTRTMLDSQVKDIETQLLTKDNFDEQITKELLLLDTTENTLYSLCNEYEELLKTKEDMMSVATLLKDDAIKASVVDKYMPFLNKKVNDYIEKLNLFVSINIDKEFNIELNVAGRKGQSISDLSSGQMRRIDLAVMMAWRDIGMSTSSLSTNLLILDETLENLSAQGVADFIEFFNTNFSDTSLFVISQRRDEFREFFENEIYLTLDSEGFTRIVDNV